MRTPESSSSDTVQVQLRDLPPEAALFIRDLIRGLEAEAGAARALSARAELRAVRAQERADRAVARESALEADRDGAHEAARAAAAEVDALRRRVEELEQRLAEPSGRARR